MVAYSVLNFQRLVEISYAFREKSITGRCLHFSFILNKSKILSIASNDYRKSHPKTLEYNYHPNSKIHSEMKSCLKLGLSECSGLTMVNLRLNKQNLIDNSYPCCGCYHLVSSLGFKKMYFTNKMGEFEELIF